MMMIKGEGEEGERKGEIPNDNDKGWEKLYGRKGKRSLRIMIIKGGRGREKEGEEKWKREWNE